MMRRRTLVICLGAPLAWGPLGVLAQRIGSPAVVGVLAFAADGSTEQLQKALRALGYVEGSNIRFEIRATGDRYARLADFAEELVRLRVDVIVALGNTATAAAKKATSNIPIVMHAAVDPVAEKLAVSLSRPGGNLTGVTTIGQETVVKRLELAKEVMPGLTRVGVLWSPDSRGSTNSLAQARAAAEKLDLRLQVVEARTADDFEPAFESLAKSGVHLFVLMGASMFQTNHKALLESAARHRLAGIFPAGYSTREDGFLVGYGPDRSATIQRAAVHVDKILKGAKPNDLPIEQPTKFEIAINLRAARALGIKVQPSLLLRADRVIQ